VIIREYFENPACTLLCIYLEVDTLKARLSISNDNQSDFMYFLRIPWHVFTVDNFHATVVFGSINRNAMMCVLKVMENMYVTVARDSGEWPESIFFLIRRIVYFEKSLSIVDLKTVGLKIIYDRSKYNDFLINKLQNLSENVPLSIRVRSP